MPFLIDIVFNVNFWSRCLACTCGPSGRRKVRNICSSLSCIRWGCWLRWRIWMTILFMILYVFVSFIWLSSLTYAFIEYNPFSSFKTWYVGSFFVLSTTAMTIITLRQHWVHYTRSDMQRYIIRIALFVHSYGFYSWLSLRFPKGSVYFSAFREIQEAYALYCFFAYLMNYLKAEHSPLKEVLVHQPPKRLCCCSYTIPRYFVVVCRIGVLQFSVIRVILTIITVIAQIFGDYGEGEISLRTAFLYVQVTNAISQIGAMVFLNIFYRGTSDLLKPINPRLKFAVIQAIIFVTSFQSLFITILGRANVIRDGETWEEFGFSKEPYTTPTTGITNFLVTVEMFLASVAVFFVFYYIPFVHRPANGDVPFVSVCMRAFNDRNDNDSEQEEGFKHHVGDGPVLPD